MARARWAKARDAETLYQTIGHAMAQVTQQDIRNWFASCGYSLTETALVPNVVFPTGLLLRGDELWMYYGAADTHTCLATAKLKDVLAALEG